jgi:hypothetical protein
MYSKTKKLRGGLFKFGRYKGKQPSAPNTLKNPHHAPNTHRKTPGAPNTNTKKNKRISKLPQFTSSENLSKALDNKKTFKQFKKAYGSNISSYVKSKKKNGTYLSEKQILEDYIKGVHPTLQFKTNQTSSQKNNTATDPTKSHYYSTNNPMRFTEPTYRNVNNSSYLKIGNQEESFDPRKGIYNKLTTENVNKGYITIKANANANKPKIEVEDIYSKLEAQIQRNKNSYQQKTNPSDYANEKLYAPTSGELMRKVADTLKRRTSSIQNINPYADLPVPKPKEANPYTPLLTTVETAAIEKEKKMLRTNALESPGGPTGTTRRRSSTQPATPRSSLSSITEVAEP